jgi:hypothetical protein
MAEITDIGIENWSTTAASNLPTDGERVGRNLPRQWRNMKSITRGLSLEKEWIRVGKTPLSVNTPALTPEFCSFSFRGSDGNLTSYFQVGRKVRMRPLSTTLDTVYAVVWSSSYAGVTTVYIGILSGVLVAGAENYWVDVGADGAGVSGYPLFVEQGAVTISDANTTGTITFTYKQPDVDYFLKTTVSSTTSAVAGAATVIGTAKTVTGATITLHDAPTLGFSTVVGWALLRELF